ncbi:MAG: MoaD/ThiS family protein [Candidatus Aenigmarchaeota archaeon]|nr:MoaD/ThiS family protein [Candidatus Aenigmarchaeota archaeon]MCK5477252.1 MoaD/ThiS family protein [Candidatus Aenigmarchaeota archaeon]
MKINLIKDKKKTTISFDGETVSDLLKFENTNPETVLIKINKKFATEDEILNDGDVVELIDFISKG